MGILAWIILGLIAGAIAKLIYPGRQGGGIFATIGLGVLGALIGGFLARVFLGIDPTGLTVTGIICAIIGAIVLIFLWGVLTRSSTR
ncbi:MAG: GlsB/YeaQ/YmgE family stress response membrane protein [Chloroflexaceae bacterium]|nr:GlsB/YeaQ/YmgE family stress response membrane protein [Chloroflexaceae bacterium]